MRWAQLTLVEDDPGKFDLQFWLDYFKRTHSDAVCLSAGGCVAYYPTKIPLAPSQQVARRRAIRSANWWRAAASSAWSWSRAPIRMRPTTTCYDAHPDWIAVDADGNKRRHWASPEMWVTCALGPYNFEFMTEVTREIMSPLPGGRHLQQPLGRLGHVLLRALPEEFPSGHRAWICRARTNPQDPARRAYILWRQQRLFELWRLWDGEIRKINPDACVHREHRRRRDQRARHEDDRRTGADAVRRPPGARAA